MALIEESGFESKIGKGTKISGKLNFRGPVKIEGEAEGEITGEEVVIATGAVVSAWISWRQRECSARSARRAWCSTRARSSTATARCRRRSWRRERRSRQFT